jgi:8-amino-7-oxononanoate synthase
MPFSLYSIQRSLFVILSSTDCDFFQQELNILHEQNQYRSLTEVLPSSSASAMSCFLKGRSAINFSSSDYLGLSQHPFLKQTAIEAIEHYGTGSGASRLISGTSDLATRLETEIAAWKKCEAALYFATGYQANVATLQALIKPDAWVFADRLNHASLVDGCRLSGARWTRYKHLNYDHLERLLQKAPSTVQKWIITDSVFSMDGDCADLKCLADIAEQYGALLYVDEAHASGLYGDRRSGLCEAQGVSDRVAIQMGTFSKALGGSGAYVVGKKVFIDYLINTSRGFIYSTAPSPPVIAAAMASIQLVQKDASFTETLWKNVHYLQKELLNADIQMGQPHSLKSPIVPLLTKDPASTLMLSEALLEQGYYLHPIRPPSVPPGESRLRLSLSAAHSKEEINGLVKAITQICV